MGNPTTFTMLSPRLLRPLAALLLAACAPDTPLAPVQNLPPLEARLWHVQRADGQQLPALIAHRLVDGSLEQTFLDSATIEITANGTWIRRFWMQRILVGERVASEASQMVGTWTATPEAYRFVEEPSGRVFEIPGIVGDTLTLVLSGIGANDLIVAQLGTTPPAPGPVGTWAIEAVRDVPIPSAMYVFDDYEENGVEMSTHLVVDSAVIVLHPNGSYQHRIHFTEWEALRGGPPTRVRFLWVAMDFGSWTRVGTQLDFASGWLEGMRMAGQFGADGKLRMQHGISHGDEWVPVRYARR
jgi:hypothetical protein